MTISGKLIDLHQQRIYNAEIQLEGNTIRAVKEVLSTVDEQYILPGLIDAHIHVESSMLVPTEFARLAVVHGTVATISDPHEIANVLGIPGVDFMIKNGQKSPFKFYFGAPSCVPATKFETAGAEITRHDVEQLMQRADIYYLAEMMNWPGVLQGDKEVLEKIAAAHRFGKPVDGHAPGLRNDDAKKYIDAGISTDHECFTAEEALDKLRYGMKILIREGSAAKNFEALAPLIPEYYQNMMFCSDDKHPDSLLEGHINLLIKRCLQKNFDIFKVLQMACINPVNHYKLDVGLLRAGDKADFIIIDHPEKFNILKTFINGQQVAERGKSLLHSQASETHNHFSASLIEPDELAVSDTGEPIKVIEVLDGELITRRIEVKPLVSNGQIIPDQENDILKLVVVNRYKPAKPAIAFIKNMGFRDGAIVSSVAHDSHNIIAAGTSDEFLARAINLVIQSKGGIAAVNANTSELIPLPVAGLMSNIDGYQMAADYIRIDQLVKQMGSKLKAPFMSLSFMALLVIPSIKLSDLGLFDAEKFRFIE